MIWYTEQHFILKEKVMLNGFSSLIYWNNVLYPTSTLLHAIRHNHFLRLDESYRITVKLYLAERYVYQTDV